LKQAKKHILFICSWYPSEAKPTIGDFVKRHAEAISLIHKVSVLYLVPQKGQKNKINVTYTNTNGVHTYIAYLKPSQNFVIKFIRHARASYKLLKMIGLYDLIHVHVTYPFGLIAWFLKKFSNKQYLITEHWSGYHFPEKISVVDLSLTKKIIQNASHICPVSESLSDAMQQIDFKGDYHVIPNVVDTSLFQPAQKEGDFTLVHISSLEDNSKNISGILNVAQKLYENSFPFKLKVIGGSAELNEHYKTKFNLPKNVVEYYEPMPQNQLVKHLQSAHALLLFSRYETFSIVVKEAFACGIPVIATDVGAIAEYFPESFGILIPSEDEKAMYQAITDFKDKQWASPQEMHKYIAEKFSPIIVAKQYDILYQQMT
jgi:glycosyltransferase involved in cell wall biosynthesis